MKYAGWQEDESVRPSPGIAYSDSATWSTATSPRLNEPFAGSGDRLSRAERRLPFFPGFGTLDPTVSPHRSRSYPLSQLTDKTPQPSESNEITGHLVFLGTGTSVGVPALGCSCPVCASDDVHNQRTRSSVVVGLPEGNLLVDTAPDLRQQLLREKINLVHAVIFTHEHADHLYGLDDLRLFPFYLGHPVPLYCDPKVERRIRMAFDYAFPEHPPTHPGAVPQLEIHSIGLEQREILGASVQPIRLLHGPRFEVLGFRFGNIAYCTDTNEIPDESWPLLEGLDVLVIDALRARPHVTHFSLEEAVEVSRRVGARRTLFTHISHELDHAETNATLPDGMDLAFDGLRVPLS